MQMAIFHDLPSGGAKRAVYEVARRLAANHDVDVYTLSTAEHSFCDLRPLVRHHEVFDFVPTPPHASPLGRLNQWRRSKDLDRLAFLSQRIAAEIDRRRYDIAYVHPSMWTEAPTVLSFLKIPTVYHLHEILRRVYDPPIPRPYRDRQSWRKVLDRVDPLLHLYTAKLRKTDSVNTAMATRLMANSLHRVEHQPNLPA